MSEQVMQSSVRALDEQALLQAPWLQQATVVSCANGQQSSATLLAGLTSSFSDIYVQCLGPACGGQAASSTITSLADLVQHNAGDVSSAAASDGVYVECGTEKVPFAQYMRQEAERLGGRQLVGAQLWQYRFDTATIAAAGAQPGIGSWQPAQIVSYDAASGQHEVEFAANSALPGSRCTVFLAVCAVHFGDKPPAPGSMPSRQPSRPAGLQQVDQQELQQQQGEEVQRSGSPMEPAVSDAVLATSPAGADADTDGMPAVKDESSRSVHATAQHQQQQEQQQEQEQQQTQPGRGRRQAALAASAVWAPTKRNKVASADAAKRSQGRATAAAGVSKSPSPAAAVVKARAATAAATGRSSSSGSGEATAAAAAARAGKPPPKKRYPAPQPTEHPVSALVAADAAAAGEAAAAMDAAAVNSAAAAAAGDAATGAAAAVQVRNTSSNRRKRVSAPSTQEDDKEAQEAAPMAGLDLGADGGADGGPEQMDWATGSHKFKNVLWSKRVGRWQATVSLAGRYRYFGLYTTQEEAACACDRAALVYKGVNAKVLYYPLSTYLEPDQQQLLQALMQEAQVAAARGTMPLPKMPPGNEGVAALRAAAAAQQQAAAEAGEVLEGPPECTLLAVKAAAREASAAAERPPVDTTRRSARQRGGGAGSTFATSNEEAMLSALQQEQQQQQRLLDLRSQRQFRQSSGGGFGEGRQRGASASADGSSAGAAAAAAAAGAYRSRASSEPASMASEGTEPDQGPTPQAAQHGSAAGDEAGEGADVAAQSAAAGDRRDRKRKLPAKPMPQKARKVVYRDGSSAGHAGVSSRGGATAGSSGGSPDVGQQGPDLSAAAGHAGDSPGAAAAAGLQQQSRQSVDSMDVDEQQQQQLRVSVAAAAAAAGASNLAAVAARRKPAGRSSASRHNTPQPAEATSGDAGADGGHGATGHSHGTRRAMGMLRASPVADLLSRAFRKSPPAVAAAAGQLSAHQHSSSSEGEDSEGDDDAEHGHEASGDEGVAGRPMYSTRYAAAAAGGADDADGEGAASTRRSQRQAARLAQRGAQPRADSMLWARSLLQRPARDSHPQGQRQRSPDEGGTPKYSSHHAEGMGGRPAAAAAAAAAAGAAVTGVSHRPLTRSRTKVKAKGRQRFGRPASAAAGAAVVAAKPSLLSPGRQPLLAAMLAAVADELPADEDEELDEQEEEQHLSEAAAAEAEAAAAAEAKARELVDAVMAEAAAGFPNLPDVDDEDEDVAQLLLDLNAATAAAAAAGAGHSDEDGSSEDEEAEGGEEDDAAAAAGAAAGASIKAVQGQQGLRKRRTYKRRRDRGSPLPSRIAEQEDWAPGRKHRKGKNRGRLLTVVAAAAPAAPAVRRERGRPLSAVPPPPPSATGAALGMPAVYVPPGFFMAPVQPQQQPLLMQPHMAQADVLSGSGSDSEDSAAEGLTAQQVSDRMASKLVQAMTAAFSTGNPASQAYFQRLYRRYCSRPAVINKAMAYVFQLGNQLGQNIVASGQANSMAAALGGMATGMSPAGDEAAAAAAGSGTAAPAAAATAASKGQRPASAAAAATKRPVSGVAKAREVGASKQAAEAAAEARAAQRKAALMQQYADLLHTSGDGSSSSVLSDSEDETEQAAFAASCDTATAAGAGATGSSKLSGPAAAAAAAHAAAAAVEALKVGGGGLPAKLPPVPPCFGSSDPTTLRALMGVPLSSGSSSGSSGSDVESDDFEIAQLAARVPKLHRMSLLARESTGHRTSIAGSNRGPVAAALGTFGAQGATSPPAAEPEPDAAGSHEAGSRAVTEGVEGQATAAEPTLPSAAATAAGKQGGPEQQAPKATQGNAGPSVAATAQEAKGKESEAVVAPPPPAAAAAAAPQALQLPVGLPRAAASLLQPTGYLVVPRAAAACYASALGATNPHLVGAAWNWQQVASLQALQQQQLLQQQQALFLLQQQQQQQAVVARAALLQQQQQLLAQHAANKAQSTAAGPAAQLVLNLQQPAAAQQPRPQEDTVPNDQQTLPSPGAAAKAGKPASTVVALNLAAPSSKRSGSSPGSSAATGDVAPAAPPFALSSEAAAAPLSAAPTAAVAVAGAQS